MKTQYKWLLIFILAMYFGEKDLFANRGINLQKMYEKQTKSYSTMPPKSPYKTNPPNLDQRIPKEYLQNIQRSRASSPYIITQKQALHLNQVIKQSAKHTKKSHEAEKEHNDQLQKYFYHQFSKSHVPNYDPDFRRR